ncbi:hypothetical protein [Hyalangium sp.]|uniref:hypothetical protein n=1 Tax=Hyalangium sp. TaxID=2028555 RepID=UPI002D60391E|nr:hypothetical protein [Hyalangium sp.]HYI01200.1 hypothetical protein [Hyalangium sp.]
MKPAHSVPAASAGPWRAALALALGLTVAGCGGNEPEPQPPMSLELGTGRQQFTPLNDGDTLGLQRGCQGGQHIFVSLRAWGLPPEPVMVELSLTRTEDEQKVSSPFRVRYLFAQGNDLDAPDELTGLLLVIPEPDKAVGRAVRVTAAVQTDPGDRATHVRTGTLQWGADACP